MRDMKLITSMKGLIQNYQTKDLEVDSLPWQWVGLRRQPRHLRDLELMQASKFQSYSNLLTIRESAGELERTGIFSENLAMLNVNVNY